MATCIGICCISIRNLVQYPTPQALGSKMAQAHMALHPAGARQKARMAREAYNIGESYGGLGHRRSSACQPEHVLAREGYLRPAPKARNRSSGTQTRAPQKQASKTGYGLQAQVPQIATASEASPAAAKALAQQA